MKCSAMAQMLAALRESFWFHGKRSTLCIDSWTFRLFNKVTSALLVMASLAVTARQFFGDPILCDAGLV